MLKNIKIRKQIKTEIECRKRNNNERTKSKNEMNKTKKKHF